MSKCTNNYQFSKRSQEKQECQLYLSPSSDFYLEDSVSGNNPSINETFRRLERQLQVEVDQEKEKSKILKEKLKCREKSFYELKAHLEELRLNYELKEKECEMLKGSNQLLFELSARKESINNCDESYQEQTLSSNNITCKSGLLQIKLTDQQAINDKKSHSKKVQSINNGNVESMFEAEKRLEEIKKKKLQWYNSCVGLKSHQSEDLKSQKTTRASENSSYQEEQATGRSERKCQDCNSSNNRDNYQNNLLISEINRLQEYVSRQSQKEKEMEQKYTQIAVNQQEMVSNLQAEIEKIKFTYANAFERIQSECFGIIQIMQGNSNDLPKTSSVKIEGKQLNFPCSDLGNSKIIHDKNLDGIFQSLQNMQEFAQNCSESVILCENLKQMMINTPTLHNRQMGCKDLITLQDCWRHFKLVNQHYLQLLSLHKDIPHDNTQTQLKCNRFNNSNKSCDNLAKNNKNNGLETKDNPTVIRTKRTHSLVSKESISSQKNIQNNKANSKSNQSNHKIHSQQIRNPTQIQAQKTLKQPGFNNLPHSPYSAISIKSGDTTLPLSNPFYQENRKSSIHSIGNLSTVDASFKAAPSQADLHSHQEFRQQQNKEQHQQQKQQGFQPHQVLKGPRQQATDSYDHYSRSRSSNNSQPRMVKTPNFS